MVGSESWELTTGGHKGKSDENSIYAIRSTNYTSIYRFKLYN